MSKKYHAFTLAEVLITLAIIGVVAALTIPAVVQKHKEQVTVTRVKKAYSALNQAYRMAMIDYGPLNNWGLAETTGETNDEGLVELDYTGAEKVAQILAKYLNGSLEQHQEYELYSLTNQQLNAIAVQTPRKDTIQLNDGMRIAIGYVSYGASLCKTDTEVCSDILLYTDSKSVKQQGYNLFYFQITDDSIRLPGNNDIYSFSEDCNINVQGSRENGRGCTAWIIQEGNMNYLNCGDLELNGSRKQCN